MPSSFRKMSVQDQDDSISFTADGISAASFVYKRMIQVTLTAIFIKTDRLHCLWIILKVVLDFLSERQIDNFSFRSDRTAYPQQPLWLILPAMTKQHVQTSFCVVLPICNSSRPVNTVLGRSFSSSENGFLHGSRGQMSVNHGYWSRANSGSGSGIYIRFSVGKKKFITKISILSIRIRLISQ